MKRLGFLATLCLGLLSAPHASAVDIGAFVKKDRFNDIKLSPTGEYYAATVPFEDRTALAILRRADNKVTANFVLGKNTHVSGFSWVNAERVIITIAEKSGSLDQPQPDGNLYAINADGTRPDILVGWKVQDAGLGTKIKPKKEEMIGAALLDDLPNDDRNVLIETWPPGNEPYTRVEKMDVYSGRRQPITRVPVRRASFLADNAGVVRFAHGADSDNSSQLYYRKDDDSPWELLGGETVSRRDEVPLGFSADNRIAYLQVEQERGPDAIVAFDTTTRERKEILRDDNVDPYGIIYRAYSNEPVGVHFMDGRPRSAFFDAGSPEARLQRLLDASFGGDVATITSRTRDGNLALVSTWSDRNPGDFFVFDVANKKAAHLLSRREWFDPTQMAEVRPVQLSARDGLALHGYLTVPHGSNGSNLPLVLMPHGGPYGVADAWGFADDTQLLAAAGYAVLQVNFRGSGGYGRAFHQAGKRQWGGTMQDDLTDATRWAIAQGIADPARICIAGGSYGAYAALMGVAREPALYRCAIGYVGVYDLPTMHTNGDIQRRSSGENYLNEWIGPRDSLAAASPNRMADRIKVPVLLAAGGEDERAPIEHSKMMEQALNKAGVPVETLYFDTEGHGFYKESSRREYYSRVLAFLSRHLGGKTASVAASGGAGSGK